MENVTEIAKKIIEFAILNNKEETEVETTQDKPTFFVRFSGYCSTIEVNINPFGWGDNAVSESYSVYLTRENAAEQLQYAYDRMVAIQDEWNSSRSVTEEM